MASDSMTIYKYVLEVTDEQTLSLPDESNILTVQTQRNEPCLWVLLDTAQTKRRDVTIWIRGTDHPTGDVIGEGITYLGTFQLNGGAFVGHVFGKVATS